MDEQRLRGAINDAQRVTGADAGCVVVLRSWFDDAFTADELAEAEQLVEAIGGRVERTRIALPESQEGGGRYAQAEARVVRWHVPEAWLAAT